VKFRIALLVLFSVATLSTVAQAHRKWPQIIPVNIEKAYVPVGYDDNDLITVVTTGTLKKSCQWAATPEVKVENNARTVTIKQIVHGYPSTCVDTAIPYSREVEIGMLPAGEYAIIDGVTNERVGTLPVEKAKTSTSYGPYVDEVNYALVETAYVTHLGETEHTLVLNMKLPGNCLRFKEVLVDYPDDVIVVRPIAEPTGDANCSGELRSQRAEVKLRSNLKGMKLLHVRSLWGRSLNRLLDMGQHGSDDGMK